MRVLSLFGLALVALSAEAKVFTVNAGDAAGLVQAIELTNLSPGADIIQLQGGWYVLERAHDEGSNAGLPTVRGDLRIMGNRSEIRRYSQSEFRLLAVARGAHLVIDNITLAEGSLGAVANRGTFECRYCAFVDNIDRRGQGILENFGTMTLHASDIGFNDLGSVRGEAGIVLNYGTLTISDSKIYGNSLARRFQRTALANGVLNYGRAQLSNVRLHDNRIALDYSEEAVAAIINLGNGEVEMREVSDEWLISAQ